MRIWNRHPYAIAGFAAGLAAGVLLLFCFSVGWSSVIDALTPFRPIWLALIAGAVPLSYLGYALAYHTTARIGRGPRLTAGLTAQMVAAGFGPFEVGGGFALDYKLLHSVSGHKREAAVRVMGLSALEYVILAPAATAAALDLLLTGGGAPLALTLPWIIAVPLGFVLGFWLCHPGNRPMFLRRRGRIRDAIEVMLEGLYTLLQMARFPERYGWAFFGLALYWAGEIASLYGATRLFGEHVSIAGTVLVYATGYAATRRTLPLGGAGATEALLVLSFHWIGLPIAQAIPAVAAYRGVNLVLSLLPALGVRPTVERLMTAPEDHAGVRRVRARYARRMGS